MIGERGLGLSGGQRQRIALARAMLRDPAILILDEATSAVDIQDEALIRKAIEEFARDRTTFLITHSLGSLQFADRIVLMNAGRIEAVGTDSELRRTSPLYRRLHEIHFQRRRVLKPPAPARALASPDCRLVPAMSADPQRNILAFAFEIIRRCHEPTIASVETVHGGMLARYASTHTK